MKGFQYLGTISRVIKTEKGGYFLDRCTEGNLNIYDIPDLPCGKESEYFTMAQARYQLDMHWTVWYLLEGWLSSPE